MKPETKLSAIRFGEGRICASVAVTRDGGGVLRFNALIEPKYVHATVDESDEKYLLPPVFNAMYFSNTESVDAVIEWLQSVKKHMENRLTELEK